MSQQSHNEMLYSNLPAVDILKKSNTNSNNDKQPNASNILKTKAPTKYALVKYNGENKASYFPLDGEEITLGRNTSCTIHIEYPSASNIHGRICYKNGSVNYEDCSSYGTLITRKNMKKRYNIKRVYCTYSR